MKSVAVPLLLATMPAVFAPGCATPSERPAAPTQTAEAQPDAVKPAEADAPADASAALMQRGHDAFAAGDMAAAADAFGQAVQADPSLAEAHPWLGVALRKLERFDDSLAASLQALELSPDYAEARGNVGNIYYRKGDHDAALENLRQALSLKPDF
ncbi:MAG: tetratricopeptide repeat protein, partial [Planctomycetota bacterium]